MDAVPIPNSMASLSKEYKDEHDKVETASRPPSLIDEKELPYVDEKGALRDLSRVGEVYAEGPRLIDLGENGKERPIGN